MAEVPREHSLPPAALALVVTALPGWLDEGIQALLPNRVYDNFDVLTNVIAALMAILANLLCRASEQCRGAPTRGRRVTGLSGLPARAATAARIPHRGRS